MSKPAQKAKRARVRKPVIAKMSAQQTRAALAAGGWPSFPVNQPRPRRQRKPRAPRQEQMFRANRNTQLNGRQGRVVEEDEFIGEVLGSNSSTVVVQSSYAVNPGQKATFPWLAPQAASWEHWRCEKLEFYYKPEVSEYATGGQTGKVILSHDYDANDAPPASKQQAEDTVPHADAMAYKPISLSLSPELLVSGKRRKYVRPGNVPGGADISNYDGGLLTVTTLNNGTTGSLGELHVRYRFVLETPVLESTTTAPRNNQVALFQSTTAEASGATTVPAQLLLATATANGLAAVNTSGSIVLPPGNYSIDAYVSVYDASNAVVSILDVQKNGTSLITSTEKAGTYVGDSGYPTSDSIPMFVSMNGTDALTLVVTNTYAGGACTNSGILRIVAA